MARPIFKSRSMVRLEQRIDRPLEDFLRERYATSTQDEIAAELGVSNASVSRWMRELGIEARLPGQRPKEQVA